MRFIHTADIHLDAPFAYLPDDRRRRKQQAVRDGFGRIVGLAIDKQVDAVLIAGDLFNTPDPLPDTVDFVLREINRLAGKAQVVIVPGNHDFYQAGGVWDSPRWPSHVHVFKADEWTAFAPDVAGLPAVAGIACRRTGMERRVLKDLDAGEAPVAMMHGAHKLDFYEKQQSYPFSEDEVAGLPVKYLALGHYHNQGRVGKGPAYYSGTPEGLSFGETGPRAALLVDLSGDKAQVEPLELGQYLYYRHELDCTAFSTPGEIEAAVAELSHPNNLVKIELTGTPPPELAADVDSLTLSLAERFFYVDIKDRLALPGMEAEGKTGAKTIKGIFLERMRAKTAAAVDDDARRAVNLATRLGLAALEGRLPK